MIAAIFYGWYTIGIGVLMMLIVMGTHASGPKHQDTDYFAIMLNTVWQIIPGIAFLFLANRMRAMALWSFYIAIVLCGWVFINMLFNLIVALAGGGIGNVAGITRAVAWQLPAILLAAMVIHAMPDVRRLRRARSRQHR